MFISFFSLLTGVKVLTLSQALMLLKIKVMIAGQMSVRVNLAICQLGYKLNISKR
jgi:hypothetical protein